MTDTNSKPGTAVTIESDPDREISVSHLIAGPRDLVFSAFTNVDHLGQWWGPDGFTTTTHSFEFREGGVWAFTFHGPDGTDYSEWIEWLEISRPERLVIDHGEHEGDPNAFRSVFTFEERDDGTQVTLWTLFKTKEQRDQAVEQFGAIEGGRQTLANLGEYVASMR